MNMVHPGKCTSIWETSKNKKTLMKADGTIGTHFEQFHTNTGLTRQDIQAKRQLRTELLICINC